MKNKLNTERKLINAVDLIVKSEGFEGLGVNKVARKAGVSKILIYRYFGSFGKLLKRCIKEKDFWETHMANSPVVNCDSNSLKELVNTLLKDQFDDFYKHCEMEALIVKGVAGKNNAPVDLSNNRKYYCDDKDFPDEELDDSITYFRLVSKLLIAGTTQLILQSPANPSISNGQNNDRQKEELHDSIAQILEQASIVEKIV